MSATGIASLIVASHTVFQTIKWAGVAYLLYLGCSAMLSKSGGLVLYSNAPLRKRRTLFAQGFIIEISNRKTLLYFSAILPQFIDVGGLIAPQFIIMCFTSFVLQCAIYSAYAYLGERLIKGGVRSWIVNLINRTAGAALIFAGLKMASVTASR